MGHVHRCLLFPHSRLTPSLSRKLRGRRFPVLPPRHASSRQSPLQAPQAAGWQGWRSHPQGSALHPGDRGLDCLFLEEAWRFGLRRPWGGVVLPGRAWRRGRSWTMGNAKHSATDRAWGLRQQCRRPSSGRDGAHVPHAQRAPDVPRWRGGWGGLWGFPPPPPTDRREGMLRLRTQGFSWAADAWL